jgi:predicted nucleic acid-binding protein
VNVLADTNVISDLKRGHRAAPRVAAWFAALRPENVFTSVIVLGEIGRGIELLKRRDKPQGALLEQWYASVRQRLGNRVLPVDEPVMAIWARISVPDMLPAYDGLIAATAIAHGLAIATRDVRGYRSTGAKVINPWQD